jgi:hypothetical protein
VARARIDYVVGVTGDDMLDGGIICFAGSTADLKIRSEAKWGEMIWGAV